MTRHRVFLQFALVLVILLETGCSVVCRPGILSEPAKKRIYTQVQTELEEHLRLAEVAAQRGDIRGAILHFEKAYYFEPRSDISASLEKYRARAVRKAELYYARAQQLQGKDSVQALRDFNRALRLNPQHARAASAQQHLLSDPEVKEAIRSQERQLDEAFGSYSGTPEEIPLLGEKIEALRILDPESPLVRRIHSRFERDRDRYVSQYLKSADALYHSGQMEAAMAEFRRVQGVDPANTIAKAMIGRIQEHKDLTFFLNRARYRLGTGNFDGATHDVESALSINAEHEDALHLARELKVEQLKAWSIQAKSALENGAYQQALKFVQRALDIEPMGSDAQEYFARMEQMLEQALPRILEHGRLLYEGNHFREASELFEQLLKIQPENMIVRTYVRKLSLRLKTLESLK